MALTPKDRPLLIELSLRYVLDPTERGREIALNCISQLLENGHSPVRHCPTPLKVVADLLGPRHEMTMNLFRRLKVFFDGNKLLEEKVKYVALITGYDFRGITKWADAVALAEAVDEELGYDVD